MRKTPAALVAMPGDILEVAFARLCLIEAR
jgi:hypothetical protein